MKTIRSWDSIVSEVYSFLVDRRVRVRKERKAFDDYVKGFDEAIAMVSELRDNGQGWNALREKRFVRRKK